MKSIEGNNDNTEGRQLRGVSTLEKGLEANKEYYKWEKESSPGKIKPVGYPKPMVIPEDIYIVGAQA